jgi:hypothetical protein
MRGLPTNSRLVVILSLAAALALGTGIRHGWAQASPNGISIPSGSNPSSLVGPPPSIAKPGEASIKPPQAPPDALPGAVPRADRVAPAQGAPITDPTEALFDAVNRGDIASARDAIDRGADLEGHNVLGMTPLDLSVDLARNDISFLLLSLRNGEIRPGRRGPPPATQATAAAKPPPDKSKPAARPPAKPSAKQLAAATQPGQVAQPAAVAPRLFAGDGGTPDPAVGFLGFDNRH